MVADVAAIASCPKCGVPRRDERACPRCGLAAERMAAFAETRDAAISEVLVAAWERTITGWAEPAHHDELLRLISTHDAYAWGAAKYRDTLRARPDDAIAERQLERLRRAAEATLFASGSPRAEKTAKPYRAVAGVLAMLIVIVIAALLVALVMRRMRSTASTLPRAVPAQPMTLPSPPPPAPAPAPAPANPGVPGSAK